MANHQDRGKAEQAMFLADIFLAREKVRKENEAKGKKAKAKVKWVERDSDGRPISKRSRSGETRKRASATVVSQVVREDSPFESAGKDHVVSDCSQHLLENEMQKLRDLLAADIPLEDHPSTSASWSSRQSAAEDEWRKARPSHVNCLLSCNEVQNKKCCHCSSTAVLRCRDCLPNEWLCMVCDVEKHQALALHNREACISGVFKPIEPGVCCVQKDGRYELVSQVRLLPTARPDLCSCEPTSIMESAGRAVILATINGRYDLYLPNLACKSCQAQWTPDREDLIRSGYWPASVKSETLFAADLFTTFEEMKTEAPNLSRQGFLRMLDGRTSHFGRTGKIHGDMFQRSFLEFTYCNFQCEILSSVEHFTCPACTPNMLALCADGNRKVYRFRQSKGSEQPHFDGTFIAKDADVQSFVGDIMSKQKSTAGRGSCGVSHWSAARETARKASKLDEEGLEVVVCRHGVLLKALNMFRGEIFAYPLYLQKDLQVATSGQFYCTDIACKYWPYLEKLAVSMKELTPLLQMRPFLSIMHAKAHSTKCEIIWSGRNQEGAGTTAGEEVEMVNSYLSRCALTTKYMTKSDKVRGTYLQTHGESGAPPEVTPRTHFIARNDMLTIHAIGWNKRKQDGLHIALSCRYVKTLQKAEAASQKLTDLCSDLDCPEDMVHQWVEDVRQWAKDDAVKPLTRGLQKEQPMVTIDAADTGSDDQQQLQKSIEDTFLGVHQKKANLYSQTDSNKIRHLRRRKLWAEKKKLFETIRRYNEQVPEEGRIAEEKVEGKLSLLGGNDDEDSLIWPWEMHSGGISNIAKKKKIFDACMAKLRLQEEKVILIKEMKNHCTYLNQLSASIRRMTAELYSGENRGNLSEDGHRGFICLLRKRLLDLEEKHKAVCASYRQALGPGAESLLQEEDIQEDLDDLYESTEDSD